MQINPGLSVLQVSATHVQIGSGFRALELTGLSPSVHAFIGRLRSGVLDGHEAQVARDCDVNALDTSVLLAQLKPVLVSTPSVEHFVNSDDQDHRGSLVSLHSMTPIFTHGKLDGLSPHDRQQFQTGRLGAALQVFGLGRTGTALTQILVESGIGHLDVWDAARVSPADLGTGLSGTAVGQVRSLAVASAINPAHRRQVVHPTGWLRQPELGCLATVQFTLGSINASAVNAAKYLRHPYLPVVIRDDEIDIGPWVLPQAAVCPLCLEQASPSWNAAYSPQRTAKNQHQGGIETIAGAYLAAGLAATEILAMIDSQQVRHQVPQTVHGKVPGLRLNAFTRVHLANGWVQTFEVEPLAGCCAAAHEPRIVSTS